MDMILGELWELVMDRDAWRVAVHGVIKSWIRLSNWTGLNWTEKRSTQQSLPWSENMSKNRRHLAKPLHLRTEMQTKARYIELPILMPLNCTFKMVNFMFQFSRSVVSNSLRPRELQHARPPFPSPTPGVYPNPCPSSRWCHPMISSSVISFSSCPQSFPASGSFQMSQLFESGGQSIGVSASTSVLPMNTQDWSPAGWTGWISLQSKGLSRVFSNTTVQKHQFLSSQLSL